MMEDLAMQLLELVMNSIAAGATQIDLKIIDSKKDNRITMILKDNGKGMSPEMVQRVTDPFTTTRTTRKVGMGISFMKGLTEQCNGSFAIQSKCGKGTIVTATVQKDCIDTPPLGDLGEILMEAIQANDSITYTLDYQTDTKDYQFDLNEIRKETEGISLQEPSLLVWIKEYINQGISAIKEDI